MKAQEICRGVVMPTTLSFLNNIITAVELQVDGKVENFKHFIVKTNRKSIMNTDETQTTDSRLTWHSWI